MGLNQHVLSGYTVSFCSTFSPCFQVITGYVATCSPLDLFLLIMPMFYLHGVNDDLGRVTFQYSSWTKVAFIESDIENCVGQ